MLLAFFHKQAALSHLTVLTLDMEVQTGLSIQFITLWLLMQPTWLTA